MLQSVLFSRQLWTIGQAKSWLKQHGLNPAYKTPDVTSNFIRFRQAEPNRNFSYRTRRIGDGIELIIGFLRY
jgi:hypothetical protein